jgi:hypothetical protein
MLEMLEVQDLGMLANFCIQMRITTGRSSWRDAQEAIEQEIRGRLEASSVRIL